MNVTKIITNTSDQNEKHCKIIYTIRRNFGNKMEEGIAGGNVGKEPITL